MWAVLFPISFLYFTSTFLQAFLSSFFLPLSYILLQQHLRHSSFAVSFLPFHISPPDPYTFFFVLLSNCNSSKLRSFNPLISNSSLFFSSSILLLHFFFDFHRSSQFLRPYFPFSLFSILSLGFLLLWCFLTFLIFLSFFSSYPLPFVYYSFVFFLRLQLIPLPLILLSHLPEPSEPFYSPRFLLCHISLEL